MTRLYLSGPMSDMPDNNFPAFNEAATQLRAAGYEVENPADTGVIEGWSWADYLRYDLPLLLKCDGVATLPGWENSRGASLEVHVADTLGMPINRVGPWVMISKAEVGA